MMIAQERKEQYWGTYILVVNTSVRVGQWGGSADCAVTKVIKLIKLHKEPIVLYVSRATENSMQLIIHQFREMMQKTS